MQCQKNQHQKYNIDDMDKQRHTTLHMRSALLSLRPLYMLGRYGQQEKRKANKTGLHRDNLKKS